MRGLTVVGGAAVVVAVACLSAPRPQAQTFTSAAGTLPAPDPNVPLYFEVASIKPSNADNPGAGIRRQPGGRFNTVNTAVRQLILFAYQIQSFQLVGGPEWIANERYDIVAKMEGDPPAVAPGTGADHMMLALRSLLADRFKLVIRRETRQTDIYALTMARPGGKPGPGLKPASGDCSPEAFAARRGAPPPPPGPGGMPAVVCGISQGPGRIRFGGYPLSLFANSISNQVGRAVIDHTGLPGNWDFELRYAPEVRQVLNGVEVPVDPDAPSLFTAVQEQLGLKFESTKGPVEVLVIERVEHPTPD